MNVCTSDSRLGMKKAGLVNETRPSIEGDFSRQAVAAITMPATAFPTGKKNRDAQGAGKYYCARRAGSIPHPVPSSACGRPPAAAEGAPWAGTPRTARDTSDAREEGQPTCGNSNNIHQHNMDVRTSIYASSNTRTRSRRRGSRSSNTVRSALD